MEQGAAGGEQQRKKNRSTSSQNHGNLQNGRRAAQVRRLNGYQNGSYQNGSASLPLSTRSGGRCKPRCSYAAGVARRPRGVRTSRPVCNKYGSITSASVSISSPRLA